ncbi:hypothetical protein BEE62_00585 [Marinobacter nauticus]|uniref:Uncharacterized protein n=1 Tax=Marinobacter nauticus TaxID=2743 RepID=A0A1M2UTV2_MARNT|nr:hypothetical protein BEE62_00585 [Marinobacter nauticus]
MPVTEAFFEARDGILCNGCRGAFSGNNAPGYQPEDGTVGISFSNTSSPLASWSRNRAGVKLELER